MCSDIRSFVRPVGIESSVFSERSVQLKNGMERARHYATYHNLVPFNPENEANPIKQYTPVSFEFLERERGTSLMLIFFDISFYFILFLFLRLISLDPT